MAAEQLSCHITSATAAITQPNAAHITRCQRLHFSVKPSFGPMCTLLQSWMVSLTAMLPAELQSNFCIAPTWQAAGADIRDRDGILRKCCIWLQPENLYVQVTGKHLHHFWITLLDNGNGNICMEDWFVCFFNSLSYNEQWFTSAKGRNCLFQLFKIFKTFLLENNKSFCYKGANL